MFLENNTNNNLLIKTLWQAIINYLHATIISTVGISSLLSKFFCCTGSSGRYSRWNSTIIATRSTAKAADTRSTSTNEKTRTYTADDYHKAVESHVPIKPARNAPTSTVTESSAQSFSQAYSEWCWKQRREYFLLIIAKSACFFLFSLYLCISDTCTSFSNMLS